MRAMSYLIAQATIDATSIIGWWQAAVAAGAPIVIGLTVNEGTRKRIKQALPALTAIGVALITKATNSDAGRELLLQAPIVFAAIQGAYQTFNGLTTAVLGKDLNDLLAPKLRIFR